MLEEDLVAMRDIVSRYGVNGVIHVIRSSIEDRVTMIVELSRLVQLHRLLVPGFKDFVEDEIRSVEDIEKMFSYAVGTFESKRVVPICIKKGIAQAFNKFSRDDFMRFESQKLIEIIRTVHPHPKNDEMSKLFKEIVDGTLRF